MNPQRITTHLQQMTICHVNLKTQMIGCNSDLNYDGVISTADLLISYIWSIMQ